MKTSREQLVGQLIREFDPDAVLLANRFYFAWNGKGYEGSLEFGRRYVKLWLQDPEGWKTKKWNSKTSAGISVEEPEIRMFLSDWFKRRNAK